MEVLIIEDEHLAANNLERQLKKINPDIEVIAKLESIADATAWFKTNSCDLIFLDIHLSDGISFNIFQEVEITTPIIFTTAYDQYALQAFKVNSLDYLLKPINPVELQQALEKYDTIKQANTPLPPVDFQSLLKSVNKEKEKYKERFMIKSGSGNINIINTKDVAYFFAKGKYIFLISKNNDEYLIDGTLEKLMSQLNPDTFFRINRQFIVSINAIDKMHTWTKSRIKISLNPPSKDDAIVSIERSSEFKKWLDK